MPEKPESMHQSTFDAFDTIDAALHTGDPTETKEEWEFIRDTINRWSDRIDEITFSNEFTYLEEDEDDGSVQFATLDGGQQFKFADSTASQHTFIKVNPTTHHALAKEFPCIAISIEDGHATMCDGDCSVLPIVSE